MPGKIPRRPSSFLLITVYLHLSTADFNTEHIGQKGPDWPGKKEEMKEQGSFDKRKASY